jgi:hypothetical protein
MNICLSTRLDFFLAAFEAHPFPARARFLRAALRTLERQIPVAALIYPQVVV